MKTTIQILVLLVIALSTLSSCIEGIIIEGNGEITEESRQLPDFNQIYSAGSFNIFYSYDDSTSVRIECESNLLPYIETAVFNKKLDIQFASHVSVSPYKDINIYVTSPSIEKIHLAGSGNVEADSLTGQEVVLMVSGSGNIYSNFYGQYLESTISGSGKMEIYSDSDTLETAVSGSGSIEIEAPSCLFTQVNISGSGKTELTGSSKNAEFKIVGSGKIKAYGFPVENADVVLAGSGNAQVNVSENLDAIISGSGNLYYIGNPTIKFYETGSGSLINAN